MIRKSESLKEIAMEKSNNKPKLRFSGFTDPWEQRKLRDVLINRRILQRQSENAPRLAFASGQGVIKLSERKTNNRDQLIADEFSKNYLLTEYNDIVYNPANLKYGAIDRNKLGRGVISPIYVTFTTEEIPSFVERIVTTEKFKLKALQFEEGTVVKRQSVNPENLLSFDEMFAPTKEEQQKIGEFFDYLDNLIAIHQHKLNHLQDKKKSLFQKMFPKNGEDFPELRFTEFTDTWEQRKLKQLANFAKGQGYSKNDLTDVGTPIILYGRLYTKYQSTISEVDTFAIPQSGSVYSTGEEVIVPASGETVEDIARASAIVKSGFLLGGDLNIIYPNKDISTIFLALSISNGKQQKELSKKAQGKSVVHLHNSDLEDVTISFPCREEQERIGSLFAHLDNLIILHQRKLNHLKEQKKALLQQMFV